MCPHDASCEWRRWVRHPSSSCDPGDDKDGAASGRTAAGFEQGLMPETYTASFSNKKHWRERKSNQTQSGDPTRFHTPFVKRLLYLTPCAEFPRTHGLAKQSNTKNTVPRMAPLNARALPPISLRVRKPVCFGSPATSFPPRGPMKRCRRFFLLFRHPPEHRSPLLGGRRLDLERSP